MYECMYVCMYVCVCVCEYVLCMYVCITLGIVCYAQTLTRTVKLLLFMTKINPQHF